MVGSGIRAIISLVDKVSGPLKNINRALRQPIKALKDLSAASVGLGQSVTGALAPLAGIGTAMAVTIATVGGAGIIKTGAQFEKFQTVLETVEGSSEKAKASMNWVADFAKKTPYQLEEVNAAFVQLRAYGLDPTNGLLRTLGDASAGMGKQIGDAVEMISDAVRGESERLKEFGVVGEKVGNEMVYRWDYNGKQMVTKAKNNSKDIQKALSGIFDKKFGGAMDKLSRTMDGLWSNIQDTVTGVYRQIGDAGVFDAVKFELQNVLNILTGWQDDGTITTVAQTISDVMVDAIWSLWAALVAIDWAQVWSDVRAFGQGILAVVDAIGGWQNALIVVAVIMNLQTIAAAVGLIGAVFNLGGALWGLSGRILGAAVPALKSFGRWLLAAAVQIWARMIPALVALGRRMWATGGRIIAGIIPALVSMVGAFGAAISATWAWTAALLANPIGLIIAGIIALAAAAYLIYENWDWIVQWWTDAWSTIQSIVDGAVKVITGLFTGDFALAGEGLKQMMSGLIDFILTAWRPVIALFETISGWLGSDVTVPEVSVPPDIQRAADAAAAEDLFAVGPVGGGGPTPLSAARGATPPVQGEIKVTFENTPPGTRVDGGGTNQPGFGLNPDVGYRRMGVI